MKLYHLSPVKNLTELQPATPLDPRRPWGVYCTNYEHINAWTATLPGDHFYLYVIDIPKDEQVLFGEDNFSSMEYNEIQVKDIPQDISPKWCLEVVLQRPIPCQYIGTVYWDEIWRRWTHATEPVPA